MVDLKVSFLGSSERLFACGGSSFQRVNAFALFSTSTALRRLWKVFLVRIPYMAAMAVQASGSTILSISVILDEC